MKVIWYLVIFVFLLVLVHKHLSVVHFLLTINNLSRKSPVELGQAIGATEMWNKYELCVQLYHLVETTQSSNEISFGVFTDIKIRYMFK